MAEEKDKAEKAAEKPQKAAKPELTPEQAAEAAAKKAARAAGKGGKGKDAGKGGGAKAELASEKVKRTEPSRLRKVYESEVRAKLLAELGLKNIMQAPKLSKITINMGLGEAIQNIKILDSAVQELSLITGQKPVITKARRSIATFKLRQGMSIGCSVTLRKERMYEFFDRLVNVNLPRVRDFRGISPKSFDGRGNFALGLKEQIIFPEIDYDKIDKVKGMNIVIVTTAKTDDEARQLLKLMGVPFRN